MSEIESHEEARQQRARRAMEEILTESHFMWSEGAWCPTCDTAWNVKNNPTCWLCGHTGVRHPGRARFSEEDMDILLGAEEDR